MIPLRSPTAPLAAALCLIAAPWAQSAPPPADGNPILEVPAIAAATLRARDQQARAADAKILQFAEPYLVAAGTETYGYWESLAPDRLRWMLYVLAPGATDLNIGFTNVFLPPGAELRIAPTDGERGAGPYTGADLAGGRQLWTAIVPGDTALITVDLPAAAAPELVLDIGPVNRGYRDLGHRRASPDKQAWCQIDVICPQAAAWRDEKRAVGRYTISGMYICTGTLVINQRVDFRPFFLTAAHCLSDPAEAPTVVVYWNYESPTCGALSGGSLNQNQSGAALRATFADSDFTLLELNAAPNPAFGLYYAGWDRGGSGAGAVVGIHHPSGDEKAFCQENDPVQSTTYLGATVDPAGTHWRVATWDLANTEPGSSGSGLWSLTGRRIVGQLHGGLSACGNTLPDWYGKLALSWTGGGTAASRLRDWLDPDNTGIMGMDGRDPAPPSPATNGLPDFVVQAITLNRTSVVEGGALTATVTVRNQGVGDADARWVDAWIHKPTAATVGEAGDWYAAIGRLAPGESRTFTHTFTATGAGQKTYRAMADSLGEIPESNEANNQRTAAYTVIAVSLGEAVDAPALAWSTGGQAAWTAQGGLTYDGVDAARSGAIGHGQQSWIQTTVTGPGTLSFWWQVSSEANYDFLRVQVGLNERAAISGEVNWQHRSVTLPAGTHILRWTYAKDNIITRGADAGGLDKVLWLPNGGIWSGAWDFGNGWKYSTWFGYFYTAHHPWVYHEHHGWLYAWGSSPAGIVFWDHAAQTYWWTSDRDYPRLYRYSDSAFLWYQQGSHTPRWFYNTANSQWESW